jgi:tRNA(fMet)-specific endonuclease VapC
MNASINRSTTGLLDTSTFIHAELVDMALLPEEIRLSTVTLAELAVGPQVAENETERALRQQHLHDALLVERLAFDDACAHAYGAIAASLRRAGRKRRVRAFDALIAATAIANGLPLFTGNADDFEGIDGLELRPVPAPGS